MASRDSDERWADVRDREFPVARRWAYFDHAAVAPLPVRCATAMNDWTTEAVGNGDARWAEWYAKLGGLRRRIARLINADADEIAFAANTTTGIGLVAEGFPWRPGDNVVTAAEEYPSNLYPWMNLADRGVETRRVPTRGGRIELDDLAAAMDDRTRLLTISHVEFASGFRNDLDAIGALCRERGAAFFVDAIQGLGPLRIDVARAPIDFLAADGHKWLLGPEGAGFLYVRRDWLDRLRTILVGSHSVVGGFDYSKVEFNLKPNASRWEGGSLNMAGLHGLRGSLELLEELGWDAVSARILENADRARSAAEAAGFAVYGSRNPGDLSGIVSIHRGGRDHRELADRLRERGVVCSCRAGRLRISPHVYNDQTDFDRLERALRECSAT